MLRTRITEEAQGLDAAILDRAAFSPPPEVGRDDDDEATSGGNRRPNVFDLAATLDESAELPQEHVSGAVARPDTSAGDEIDSAAAPPWARSKSFRAAALGATALAATAAVVVVGSWLVLALLASSSDDQRPATGPLAVADGSVVEPPRETLPVGPGRAAGHAHARPEQRNDERRSRDPKRERPPTTVSETGQPPAASPADDPIAMPTAPATATPASPAAAASAAQPTADDMTPAAESASSDFSFGAPAASGAQQRSLNRTNPR